MNSAPHASSSGKERGLLPVFIFVAAGFLLFGALILLIFKWAGPPETYDETRALDRAKKLEALREKENKELHETAWIDEKSGIARIPIDRAMELELVTLRDKPIREAGPIQPQDINPTLIRPPVTVPKPGTSP